MSTINNDTKIDSFISIFTLISIASIVFYIFRYAKFKNYQYKSYPKDLTKITMALVKLSIWNIVFIFANKYIIGLSTSDAQSPCIILLKDTITTFMIINSMILVFNLCDGILACIELISTYSFQSDKESKMGIVDIEKKPQKSVSFHDRLETYTYSDKSINVLHSKMSSGYFVKNIINEMALFRNIVQFMVALFISTLIVPEVLLLNSTTVILSIDTPIELELKFEHIYIALISVFAKQAIKKIIHLINQPQTPCFPKSTLIFSCFTWVYMCFTMIILIMMIILSNDVLYNVCKMIMTETSLDSYLSTEYSLNIFTFNTLGYLSHIISPSSLASIELKRGVLQWIKILLSNCTIVLSTCCFTLFPLILWILIVEYKINGIKNKLYI